MEHEEKKFIKLDRLFEHVRIEPWLVEWIRRVNWMRDWLSTVGRIIYYSTLDDHTSIGIVKSLCHFLRAYLMERLQIFRGSTYSSRKEICSVDR